MNQIVGKFLKQKEYRHPRSGEPLSKTYRMQEMFNIVTNVVYDTKYAQGERVLAAELIKQILEE